jgi:RNase P/RNase MRP subunit p30
MKSDINFFKSEEGLFFLKINSKKDLQKTGDEDGYYIDSFGDEKETRRIIDSLKSRRKLIAVKGSSNNFNRRVIETMKINYLVGLEDFNKPDNLKQRDSGLNHVLAKIAKKRGVRVVFNISEFNKLNKKMKGISLSKLIQNIKVLRKAGCELKIANFSLDKKDLVLDEKDRQIFLATLGCDSKIVKNSIFF